MRLRLNCMFFVAYRASFDSADIFCKLTAVFALLLQESWRRTVGVGVQHGVPMPCFTTALSFYDGYRHEMLPANLLQVRNSCCCRSDHSKRVEHIEFNKNRVSPTCTVQLTSVTTWRSKKTGRQLTALRATI